MRIAQLATNVERVPPAGYGGTELIVYLLTEELVKRGHEVTLFATGDSVTSAPLVSVTEKPLRANNAEPPSHWQAFDIRLLTKLEQMQDQFDIIHNHMGWQALPWLNRMRCPSVSTNHNPIKSYSDEIYLQYRELPFIAISESYKRLNHPNELNYLGVVYNGIECERFRPQGNPVREYLLFLGRLGRAKGTVHALKLAEKLGMPIKLAGKIDDNDEEYFATEIKPLLERDGVEYLGEVDAKEKIPLYQHAIAVVYPIDFEEPFGLVMAESMAAGTPVMAFDRGSVRELIADGETGIVGRSIDDLAARFEELKQIKSEDCIARVESMFAHRRMVDGYELMYNRALSGAQMVIR